MDDDFTATGAAVRRSIVERAGRAGVLATLVMLAVQLIWRLNWSQNGSVQAFPEFIVAAISRLTPISVFGAATENYGSLAKKTLFTAVLLGIVAIGYRAGSVAGWLSKRIDRGGIGRVAAGLLVAAALWLFTMLVVMPIAHLGVFATKSSYTEDILVQTIVTFALFGLLWAVFAAPRLAEADAQPAEGELVTRRNMLGQAAWGIGTLVATVAVGAAGWRLINPKKSAGNAAADQKAVDDAIATQRAQQTQPTQVAQAPTAATPDTAGLFQQLDAQGQITSLLTTNDDFYHVSKNLIDPTVSKDGWKLTLSGQVDQPMELTYDQVVARATQQKITTLSCISNEIGGDLTGTAQWTCFPLKDLLNEAGVKPGAIKVKFHAADDYEDSIFIDRALNPNTVLVVAMNGQPLPDDHGGPVRMIVPGIYGMKNVKWLQDIEVTDENFQGYWQTRGWSDLAMNQIWGRIDEPIAKTYPPGPMVATGIASAGDRGITRVEVSLDEGQTWADATLEPSINPPLTWVRWAYPFDATPGTIKMRMRATDGTGQVMSEDDRPPLPDGATGWPSRQFKVKS